MKTTEALASAIDALRMDDQDSAADLLCGVLFKLREGKALLPDGVAAITFAQNDDGSLSMTFDFGEGIDANAAVPPHIDSGFRVFQMAARELGGGGE